MPRNPVSLARLSYAAANEQAARIWAAEPERYPGIFQELSAAELRKAEAKESE